MKLCLVIRFVPCNDQLMINMERGLNKLKVHEVIDTKELLPGEFIENYFVIYEEVENKQFDIKNNYFFVTDCIVQKNITLFKGNSYSTLQKIKVYPIDRMDERAIRETIFKDFPLLFINVPFTSKAM